ncbi:MAG: pirin family protein [Crocinitomicaceae bacterium]|nr:pirin family protein [Crocinitomicaceae bacterium]
MRTIKQIVPAFKINMGGHILDQALPYRGVDQIDPFLLIHHWKQNMEGGQHQSTVGVGPHPHRGFSPVTFIYEGGVHHRDSTGESQVVYGGGTQWMNSGKGIVHSERPAQEIAEKGGEFEFIQFWVNAPSSHKMTEPNYQAITKEDTPIVDVGDPKVKLALVTGDYKETKGPIQPYSDVLILRIDMEIGGKHEIQIPETYNALIYQLDGSFKVNNDQLITGKNMLHLNNDGTSIVVEAMENTRLMLLSGQPINEEVSTYGPFVMNTEDEIRQAILDYQSGKMGILTEEFE